MKGYIYRDYCAFLWRHRAEHRLPAVQSQLLHATIKVWISGPVKTNRLACCTTTVFSQGHFFYRLQMSAQWSSKSNLSDLGVFSLGFLVVVVVVVVGGGLLLQIIYAFILFNSYKVMLYFQGGAGCGTPFRVSQAIPNGSEVLFFVTRL